MEEELFGARFDFVGLRGGEGTFWYTKLFLHVRAETGTRINLGMYKNVL